MNCFASLFYKEGTTLENALNAHQFVRTTISLVEEKDCTTTHGSQDWTIIKESITVHETKPTD